MSFRVGKRERRIESVNMTISYAAMNAKKERNRKDLNGYRNNTNQHKPKPTTFYIQISQ